MTTRKRRKAKKGFHVTRSGAARVQLLMPVAVAERMAARAAEDGKTVSWFGAGIIAAELDRMDAVTDHVGPRATRKFQPDIR